MIKKKEKAERMGKRSSHFSLVQRKYTKIRSSNTSKRETNLHRTFK